MLGELAAAVFAGRWLGVFAILRDAFRQCLPCELGASGFIGIWLETIEAFLEHRSRSKLALPFAGRRLGIVAELTDAELQELPALDCAGIWVLGQLDALVVLLFDLRLATVLASRWLAAPGTFEEGVKRSSEASLAVVTPSGALVEDHQGRGRARVATFTVRNAFSVRSAVENGCELGIVARGVGAAALDEQDESREKRE